MLGGDDPRSITKRITRELIVSSSLPLSELWATRIWLFGNQHVPINTMLWIRLLKVTFLLISAFKQISFYRRRTQNFRTTQKMKQMRFSAFSGDETVITTSHIFCNRTCCFRPMPRTIKICLGLIRNFNIFDQISKTLKYHWSQEVNCSYLHSAFWKIDFHGNFLSHKDVRIFCLREEFVQNFKLSFGVCCSLSALFSWRTLKINKEWYNY